MKNLLGKQQLMTTYHKVAFKARKHSPEIFIVVGIAGTIASTVLACRATTKLSKVLEESKNEIEHIRNCMNDESLADQYTKEDGGKDLTIVYVQTGVKIAKLYAPAVVLGALSLTSIITSNNIMRQRNAALAAAYATVDKSFKEYRNRVVERFGKEVEHELRYDVKAHKIEETVTGEDGKTKKTKKSVDVVSATGDYTRFFDEYNDNWLDVPEYNLGFLRAQQSYANDKLRAQGYLFLNEVYDMLGMERSKEGQVVGWIYNTKNPDAENNYVDFGIYNAHKANVRDFVNGIEPAILLDFNVQGNIYNLM